MLPMETVKCLFHCHVQYSYLLTISSNHREACRAGSNSLQQPWQPGHVQAAQQACNCRLSYKIVFEKTVSIVVVSSGTVGRSCTGMHSVDAGVGDISGDH